MRREKDEGDVRASEEESKMSEETQGDIRPSEKEEEMKREVQGEMTQEMDREIIGEGSAEADTEGEMIQEMDREITGEGAAEADTEYQVLSLKAPEVYPSLMALTFPTDPVHVDQHQIKVSSNYIQFCSSLGPCQPVSGFPKNPQGRSFQSQWYAGNNWLEYSVEKDAMYCFSCRLFLTQEKFKARTAWRTAGVVNWRKAVEKIHEHAATEALMISMVRWANYRKGHLVEAFQKGCRM